ncbi:MAG: hypothetical protein GY822_05210 [Deltaproteobacteria bacterium]|nr:hypothetical protein [Deltaproteobacteria bacterium]
MFARLRQVCFGSVGRASFSHGSYFIVAVLFAALAITFFFVQPDGDVWAGPGVKTHHFVGAQTCRSCHSAEYSAWEKGPHANALSRLSKKEQDDPRCRSCHTMVPDDVDERYQGIQCESCHGAGRYYAKDNIMRDSELRSKLLFENPSVKTCARCHTDSSPSLTPFDFRSAKGRMKHWADNDSKTH